MVETRHGTRRGLGGSMDSKRFNELTKALASGRSRRGVVKGFAAGLVGGVFGLRGRGEAEARTAAGPGRICREHANCADGLYCLLDQQTRRRKCTCVVPKCFDICTNECFDVNFTFNFSGDCTEECARQCIDPSCKFFFNQTLPI
jgi:hypothetical protein